MTMMGGKITKIVFHSALFTIHYTSVVIMSHLSFLLNCWKGILPFFFFFHYISFSQYGFEPANIQMQFILYNEKITHNPVINSMRKKKRKILRDIFSEMKFSARKLLFRNFCVKFVLCKQAIDSLRASSISTGATSLLSFYSTNKFGRQKRYLHFIK